MYHSLWLTITVSAFFSHHKLQRNWLRIKTGCCLLSYSIHPFCMDLHIRNPNLIKHQLWKLNSVASNYSSLFTVRLRILVYVAQMTSQWIGTWSNQEVLHQILDMKGGNRDNKHNKMVFKISQSSCNPKLVY